jgi:hypothetical protein
LRSPTCSIVSAAQCGYLDRDTLKAMTEHALTLQAEQTNRAEPQPTTPAVQCVSRAPTLAENSKILA